MFNKVMVKEVAEMKDCEFNVKVLGVSGSRKEVLK